MIIINDKLRVPNLKLNALLNTISSAMSIVFPLITYPYATRVLQATNLGKVNFASTTISYFSLIAVLGMTQYASREGVQYRTNRKDLNQFSSEIFTLSIFTSLGSLGLLIICYLCVPKLHSYTLLLIIYSTTILFGTVGLNWLYALEEDYLYTASRSILIQFISLILLFILVKGKGDFYQYAALNAFSNVGANIFNLVYSKKYIDLQLCFDLKKVFRHLKSCLIFFSSSIASSIYSNIDTTMLGLMTTDYNVGIYSAAVKIYVMIKTLLTATTSVTMPRLTFYIANGMSKEFQKLISNIFKMMITLLLPVVVGLNLIADELVKVLLGKGFEGSVLVIKILAFAVFFAIFATIINGCILLPNKCEKLVLKSTVVAAVFNLLTNFIAIPLWNQNGAAITTVLSECMVLIVGWHFAKHFIVLEKMCRTVLTSILGCLVITFISYLCEHFFSNLILLLVSKVSLCIFFYFFALYLMYNEIIRDFVANGLRILFNKHVK